MDHREFDKLHDANKSQDWAFKSRFNFTVYASLKFLLYIVLLPWFVLLALLGMINEIYISALRDCRDVWRELGRKS